MTTTASHETTAAHESTEAHESTAIDVARIKADFPILRRTVRDGRRAGLPRQRRHLAEAASRSSTPSAAFYEQHNAAVHRGAHQLAEEATDAYESARATIAAFIGARPTRSSSPRTRPRASTWSRTRCPTRRRPGRSGRASWSGPATRSWSPRWSTTPTSCPGRCSRSAPAPRCAGWVSPTTAGSTSSDLDRIVDGTHAVVAFTHQSNVLGTVNPVDGLVRARARGRRARPGRRRPVGATPAGRRASSSTSTSWCSPATRCSARWASACCGGATSCSPRCRRSSPAAR